MLEIRNVTKTYRVGDFVQKALDDVSVNFRKCEFASILGPSGSGKTTLLNIIGGLDRYDSGDLIINETSTKMYKDRDWDAYRNHRVGFVFQSYNLISHQTILRNVELALTLSGVSKAERKEKALKALDRVGLSEHVNKRPNQLSGGQMQRVAIARALVNDPEILLADEPTGALDTQTSTQIMDILSEIAKDRLVIMVTHNPDLAENYSTRIIKLLDGKITSDTNPYDGSVDTKIDLELTKKKTKKTSMSFMTALGLSLNNLMTKKGRTILTAFAGSIGIIGIALILSLSEGVNTYITDIQKETMLSYPITISSKEMDLSSFLQQGRDASEGKNKQEHDNNAVYSDGTLFEMAKSMTNNIYENNLTKFKKYLDDKDSEIHKYVGGTGIVYNYRVPFDVFSYDKDGVLINADGSTFEKAAYSTQYGNISSYMNDSIVNKMFDELLPSKDRKSVNEAVKGEYELVKGSWPEKYDEVVIILDKNNEISATNLYYLGLLPSKHYKELLKEVYDNKDFKYEMEKIEYDDILKKEFKLVLTSDYYTKNDKGLYTSFKEDSGKLEEFVKDKALTIKVVGIIKQNKDSKNTLVSSTVGYTSMLTDWMIERSSENGAIKEQLESKDTSVLTGLKFKIASDQEKAEEAKVYIRNLNVTDKAKMAYMMVKDNPAAAAMIAKMDEAALSKMVDQSVDQMKEIDLINIYDNYITPATYDSVLTDLGYVNEEKPYSISIYADSFEAKDGITSSIDKYNESQKEDVDKIKYNDLVGMLMSSITTIINAISYVLIAFVSISLVVSSIMIAIITYISVLERTKEIGILRAIGASKKDVTRVFNAETFIEGLVAGTIGVVITILLNIPITLIVRAVADVNVTASLPILGAIILILISIILTVIAGLIPSKIAAKKDPVEALRTE